MTSADAARPDDAPGTPVPDERPERVPLMRGRVGAPALLLGLVLYLGFAVNVTWPLMSDPGSYVLGGLSDQTGGIAELREWLQQGMTPFSASRVMDLGAPEGVRNNWGLQLAAWAWAVPAFTIALVTNATAAYGLTSVLGFVLSGLVMQTLVTRLTGSRAAGLVAGFAFAFFPYSVVKAATQPQLGHGWPLALIVWRTLEIADAPTRRNVLLGAAAAAIAVFWTPYYILMGGVLLATVAVAALLRGWRERTFKRQLLAQGLTGIIVVAMLGAVGLIALLGSSDSGGSELRENSLQAFTDYGARLHEYFVPFGNSWLFGDATKDWLARRQHGSNGSETTLYLGIVTMVLALVGVVGALRTKDRRLRWGVFVGLLIAIGAMAWSAPRQVSVAGTLIPTPSDALRHVTTTWRVMSRFGLEVMLGTTLLAGVGVAVLLRRAGRVASVAVTAILIALVAVDFNWRPGAIVLEAPEVYELAREQPRGIVAQYPLLPAGFGDSGPIYFQQAMRQRTFNGYSETDPAEERASSLYFLNQPSTPRGLAALGVRYVIVPDVPMEGTPDPGRPGAGYERIGRGSVGGAGEAGLYRVVAAPDLGYVYPVEGYGGREGSQEAPYSWITEPSATLAVDVPRCDLPCSGLLSVTLESLGGRPREVQVSDGDRRVWRGTVGARRRVTMPLEARRERTTLTIRTDPGPTPVRDVEPASADQRSLSVAVSNPRFVR